jgi:Fe-S-cluster containining protein
MQDLPIIEKDFIQKKDLYTIRKGELVRDNLTYRLVVTDRELIKIKELDGDGGGCIFYDEVGKSCTIYQHRPVQCAALKCWDTEELIKVHMGPKLTREDLVGHKILLGMIEAHEKRCGYLTLEEHVKKIESEGEKSVEKILDILKFDYQLRPFISERLGLNADEMDFFFGRPLIETIIMFGLKVTREPDGSFLLTTIESDNRSPQGRRG